MRPDTQRRPAGPAGPAEPVRDPARAAALHRLASATAGSARPPGATGPPQPWAPVPTPDQGPHLEPVPEPDAAGDPDGIPWRDADPDGRRPDRVRVGATDPAAWADPRWWERIRWAPDRVAGIALVLVVVALGAFTVHRLLATVPEGPAVPELPLAEPGEEIPPEGPDAPTPTPVAATGEDRAPGDAEEEPVVVSVVGLVGRSGLVTVAPGARVADALDSAGGVLDGGDRDGLNLARRVVDGEQILVGLAPGPDGPEGPRSGIIGADEGAVGGGPGTGGGPPPPGGTDADAPLDLNAADAAGFESLPGVGPVTASAILAWREANGPFSAVDQLAEVDGIGPATLSRLRPLVTV